MAGTRALSRTGLILETWNVGWTCMDLGSLSLTAAGLMILIISKGPMKRGASFLESTLRGRSRVESQTLWPKWYSGATGAVAVGGRSIATRSFEKCSSSLDPGPAAAVDEGLDGWAGSLPL